MSRFTRILLAVLPVVVLSAGVALGQVGTEGNVAFTISNDQLLNGPQLNSEPLIVRNRMDSGYAWTASADAMIMNRVGGKSSTLLRNTGTQAELLNAKDFDFPWSVGPRVGIVGEDILCGCDIEAVFFDIDSWKATETIVAPPEGAQFMIFNQPAIALNADDVVSYRYISWLRNTEMNVRHPLWQRLNVLAGFRYIELHEDLGARINDVDTFDANVDNHMYGGQVGLNVAIVSLPRLSIEGSLKAGVLANYSDLAMSAANVGTWGNKITHTSVLGELGLTGIFQVTNNISVRGGYQVMWLDGVATAVNQVENADARSYKPSMADTLMYHGASAGIELAF